MADPRLALFWLKARRPGLFGDKLREDEVREIQQAARRATIEELEQDILKLPKAARDLGAIDD
jgi:hypothetical protein